MIEEFWGMSRVEKKEELTLHYLSLQDDWLTCLNPMNNKNKIDEVRRHVLQQTYTPGS